MKRFGCTALLIALLFPHQAEAKVTWRGAMCITDFAAACPEGDWVIACYNMAYRPRNIGDNGPATHFAFGDGGFRYGLDLESGNIVGTAYRDVTQTLVTTSGGQTQIGLRFTSQKPAVLTETTKSVEIIGNIKDVDGYPGCNLSFRAAGVLAP